jgi:hypothetical protein
VANITITTICTALNTATVTLVTGCEVSNGPLSLSRYRLSDMLTITALTCATPA